MPDVQDGTMDESLDDYPVGSIPEVVMWSENYAFMINDPASGLALASQVGRWPVDARIWREFFMLGLPGDRIVYHKAFGKAATATVAAASLFRIEVIRPGQIFRLLFDGPAAVDTRANLLAHGTTARPVLPLSFDLLFEGVSPVWNMSGQAHSAEALAGKMHVEQVGSVSGHVTYGDENWSLSAAFGQRDHSRGIRVITQLYRHCWAQGWFPQDHVTFNLYSMAVHDGAAPMANATVSRGKERFPARLTAVDFMDGPGDHARSYAVELESELGVMRFEIARFVASMPASFTSPYDKCPGAIPGFHAASSNEEAVIWRWNGKEGPGWSERSFNAAPFPQ